MHSNSLLPIARKGLSSFLLTVLGLLGAGAANAQVVSFNFSGTLDSVTDPGGHLAGLGINNNTPFTGQISYPASPVPLDGSSGNQNLGNYSFPAGEYTLSLTLAGHTFTSDTTDSTHYFAVLNNLTSADTFEYGFNSAKLDGNALPGSPPIAEIYLSLNDNSQTAISSDAFVTAAPTVSQFPDSKRFNFHTATAGGALFYNFQGEVTNLTPVPEPAASGAVIAAGLAGFALWRRSRKPKAL